MSSANVSNVYNTYCMNGFITDLASIRLSLQVARMISELTCRLSLIEATAICGKWKYVASCVE